MKSYLASCLALAVHCVACSGSDDSDSDSNENNDGTGGMRGGAPLDPDGCSPSGARMVLTGAFEGASTDAEAQLDSQGRGVVAVMGADAAGDTLYLRRAGDIGDAAISEPGTFDVSQYPNNVQVLRFSTSEQAVSEGFIAMAGTLTVTEADTHLVATFHLEGLHDSRDVEGGPGEPIAGAVDGCIAAPTVDER